MRNASKTLLLSLFTLSLFAVCQAPSALAQSRDSKLISARAGAVNLTSGSVEFKRKTGTRWEALTNTHDLRNGDAVRTGADGRAEVLLNPGSYFRVGASTEFALVDASLDDLRLRLTRGAAVVEATGYSETDLSIVVNTPQARVRIIRTGIYRLSVLPDGRTELAVQKGRAYVGEDEALLVKGGKVVRLGSSGAAEIAKFDKKQRDELDLWSRDRGRELAKANERLNRRETLLSLASFGYDARFQNGGSGFWYLNRAVGCYTFVPYYADWRSPYGFGYGRSLYGSPCGGCNGSGYPSYDSTPRQGYPSNGGNNNGGGYAGGGGGNNGGGGGSSYPRPGNGGGNMGAPAPPPMPVQREINTERTIERNVIRTREP